MKETDYAFSVAVIRSKENSLLTKSDMDNLIDAPSFSEAKAILESKGYKDMDYENINDSLHKKTQEIWAFLEETVPSIDVFSFLVLKNDFHNLKVILKSKVMNLNEVEFQEDNNFLLPSLISPKELMEKVNNKGFESLPSFIQNAALEGYDILVRTKDSMVAELVIDKYCLDNILKEAKKTKNDFIISYATTMASFANIKTAYRLAKSNRAKEIIESALCHVKEPERDMLIESSEKGVKDLLNFLSTTTFSDMACLLKDSITLYEKEWEERILNMCLKVRNNILGPEAIIAYYQAKEIEMMNIRIIMFCKHNGIGSDSIRERVRRIYV